jgi:hypothetical protein
MTARPPPPPLLPALFGRRTAGLPPPEPVDFARLVLPDTPNAWLAAPAFHPGPKHRALPPLDRPPEAVWRVLRGIGVDFPRTWRRAEWPELRQVEWVARTPLLNFPDLITAQVAEPPGGGGGGGGSGVYLYSRSLFGRSDFGTNRRRGEQWLVALAAALRGI